MKVKNTEAKTTFRGVDFPKGKVVDLTDNPTLFAKVSKLPTFKVVENDQDDD